MTTENIFTLIVFPIVVFIGVFVYHMITSKAPLHQRIPVALFLSCFFGFPGISSGVVVVLGIFIVMVIIFFILEEILGINF